MNRPASEPSVAEGLVSWSSLESAEAVAELARFVRGGGVVVFPTESSYALGADPESSTGVAAVFRIKGRPADKPLPVVVAGEPALEPLGVDRSVDGLPALARAWPGPLTVILPLRRSMAAACGRGELAVRVPGHARLRELLERMDLALTATSANLAGARPLLSPADVARLPGVEGARILDGGNLPGGLPSTLVRLQDHRATVLRQGAIGIEQLRALAPDLEFDESFSAAAVEIPVDGSG